MFCSNCGKEIDENVKYCPYCGTAVEGGEAQVLENDSSEISTTDLMGNKKTTDKKNKVRRPFYKKKRYWILGVFLIWFIWAWFNVDIDDSETKIPNSENISEEEVVEDKKSAEEEQREKEEKAAEQEAALRAEYIFPDSDKKYLSEDEVRSITADRLYIGRNEVFARHGYIFQDANLKEHFESTSWYQGTVTGDQFNADAVFNDFEKKNVELIKRIEDEINGPSEEELAQQAAIDEAYNFLVGHSFHLQNSQPLMEFQSSDTIVYHWGGNIESEYFNYSITAKYEVYKDDLEAWMTYITIGGEEYYLRYFSDGSIDLASMSGNGRLEGWYELYK